MNDTTTIRCPGCRGIAIRLPDGTIRCADGYTMTPAEVRQIEAANELARQFHSGQITITELEQEASA